MWARQQNSTVYPIVFLMVDTLDHITGKTGLTPTVTLSKNGSAFAPVVGAVTEVGDGWYAIAANVADRDTLGDLIIHATAAGADPVDAHYTIVAFNPYDSAGLGLSRLGGNGNIAWVHNVTQSGLPLNAVHTWVSTDSAGNELVVSGYTDAFGNVTFYLNAGTYYFWHRKTGSLFTNPETVVVA